MFNVYFKRKKDKYYLELTESPFDSKYSYSEILQFLNLNPIKIKFNKKIGKTLEGISFSYKKFDYKIINQLPTL